MIDTTGGLDGLRDEGLLDSALLSADQTFEGLDLYPSTLIKIARIAFNLIKNHPFIDGNKRIGTYIMLNLLALNGLEIDFSIDEVIKIGLDLASGEMSFEQLVETIINHY
jgi:death-on-curing protein